MSRPLAGIRRLTTFLLVLTWAGIAFSVLNLVTGGSDTELSVSVLNAPLSVAGLKVQSVSGFVVAEPSFWQRVLSLFSGEFPELLCTLPMLIRARRLITEMAESHPFTPQTTSGLRRLGVLVLVLGAAAEAISLGAGYLWYRSAVVDTGHYWFNGPVPTFWWLLVGLLLLGFAQIVEHGRKLRVELDEVI